MSTNIFAFTTFYLGGQTNAVFLYVLWSLISQDLFNKTYRNVFRDYILTLNLYTARTCEFKQMWYQMHQADYCLKNFKLYIILLIWFDFCRCVKLLPLLICINLLGGFSLFHFADFCSIPCRGIFPPACDWVRWQIEKDESSWAWTYIVNTPDYSLSSFLFEAVRSL